MGLFNITKTYTTSFTKQEAKERLLNAELEASSFKYLFEEVEDNVFIANPKKEVSLYHNSFVPQIVATVLENGDIKVEFKLTKKARFLMIFFNVDAVVLEVLILLFMLYRGAFSWIALIPCGVILFNILLSTIALRVKSNDADIEIRNLIK